MIEETSYGKVTILKDEYRVNVERSMMLDMLLDAIYQGASLYSHRDEMYFEDGSIRTALKLINKERYDYEMRRLIREKEKEQEVNINADAV